ncbi:DMT family transporter [Paraglaciecola sp.]|uniref:DMT family transporter n=1 Tax=Paraglaciecola sp. TaxID=1920173 RepID=UPI003EF76FBC
MPTHQLTTFVYTLFALFAFAANSVLCRLALDQEKVDPVLFTAIRICSATVILLIIMAIKQPTKIKQIKVYGSWTGALFLLVYAVGFSYAYVTLDTATGALVLFACVQFTMLFKNWRAGNTLNRFEQLGIMLSLCGFIYFVYPELTQPSLIGFILMSLAGVAWGLYSIAGGQSESPLADTFSNFLRLTPVALIALTIMYLTSTLDISLAGLVYTIISGAIASGLGYALWYLVLPDLKASIAAVSQLSVPIWAALGGLIFVVEPISLHILTSSVIILGGILLVILSRIR